MAFRIPDLGEISPQPVIDNVSSASKGFGTFAARTGIAILDMVTTSVDLATDFLARNILTNPIIPIGILPISQERRQLNDNWRNFIQEKRDNGSIITQEAKSAVDRLQELPINQPSPDWVKSTTREKLTTRLPETLFEIGPSIVSSLGMFAINHPAALVVIAGSVADDVKEQAIDNGVPTQKAELLGLSTGILVSTPEGS